MHYKPQTQNLIFVKKIYFSFPIFEIETQISISPNTTEFLNTLIKV